MVIAVETNEGFPFEMKDGRGGCGVGSFFWGGGPVAKHQPLFAVSFATAVDVKQYNYALIYGIVALSMHEFLSIREKMSLTLTPSLLLCFSSLVYLNVNYICVGCWQRGGFFFFDVSSFSGVCV